MFKNFNPKSKIKYLLMCMAALFCVGLCAQNVKVAVLEPTGEKDVRTHFSLVRNAFIETISKNVGFQVIDRARTDQVLKEHSFQRTSGLIPENEARELGKILGVDLIFSLEVTAHTDAVEVSCQVIDIVNGRIVASKSEVIEGTSSKQIKETCQEMIGEILNTINKNVSGAGRPSNSMLPGLDTELGRLIKNSRANAKWNKNKANYDLEIDLAGLSINENRQFGTPVYIVSGTISIVLTDAESGNTADTEVEIERFTEMSNNLIRNKIRSQVQQKVNEIIRELLSGLD